MLVSLETAAARERRKIRDRHNQMQRALAAVALAVDGLRPRDQLVVLNEALRQALDASDQTTARPGD